MIIGIVVIFQHIVDFKKKKKTNLHVYLVSRIFTLNQWIKTATVTRDLIS